MRLTADLINASLSFINPLKERELDLRGHKIPAVENLGVAKDHDAIDFTDNDITVLHNFPFSPRLKTLLLSRNRVSTIQPTLANSIPNLHTLVLGANRMQELADLDPLGGLKSLTHFVCTENPVCNREHYRYWVLWLCPSIRFFDYQKVRDEERKKAVELFGTAGEPTALTKKIMAVKSRAADPSVMIDSESGGDLNGDLSITSKISKIKLTDKERKKIEEMIKNANSMVEITKLEKMLNEGRVPPGVLDDSDVTG